MHIKQRLKVTLLFSAVPIGSLVAQAETDPAAVALSYAGALQRAVESDPRLELNAAFAEAAEGQIEQAGLPPNPMVGVDAENILGTGPFSGVDGLEVTLGISQLIETADKRGKRTALARRERALLDWDREGIVAEVEASVRAAFADVLLGQQWVRLREEQLALAERSAQETAALVEAARSPMVEQTRAQLVVRQQQFALQQAQRELAAAKTVLASLWGGAEAEFVAVGELRLDTEMPAFAELAEQLVGTAAIARYGAEARAREAALDLERARAKPDLNVFAGGRYFNEADGEVGFVVGVEVPWPLFDRNQGNIRSARARLNAVEVEREVIRRELLIALNRAYQRLLNAHGESAAIQKDLLPAAEASLRETEDGYARGQFNQLAVLESRRTLFELREAQLDARMRYAAAQAEIHALTRPAQTNP